GVLEDWCEKVGRDPGQIERSVGVSGDNPEQAEAFLEHGFTHFTMGTSGPDYDLGPVRELVAWRDGKNKG
ncbi:MAG TPA: hypothetical protein VGR08_03590, partial [Thermomicrobiales bacterium]|nr:hypothetical protein [Thermomicrobiales bacterium]